MVTIALSQMVLTQNTSARVHHFKKAVSESFPEYYKIIMKKKANQPSPYLCLLVLPL